jgi:hypothetical protein
MLFLIFPVAKSYSSHFVLKMSLKLFRPSRLSSLASSTARSAMWSRSRRSRKDSRSSEVTADTVGLIFSDVAESSNVVTFVLKAAQLKSCALTRVGLFSELKSYLQLPKPVLEVKKNYFLLLYNFDFHVCF